MQAKDLMTPNPTTCGPTDDLKAVLDVMKKEDCGGLSRLAGLEIRTARG